MRSFLKRRQRKPQRAVELQTTLMQQLRPRKLKSKWKTRRQLKTLMQQLRQTTPRQPKTRRTVVPRRPR